MKLSKMRTDELSDALVESAPFVAEIAGDEELIKTIAEETGIKTGMSTIECVACLSGTVAKLVRLLLKKNRSAAFGILGAINGKTAEEIAQQNGLVTAGQIFDLVTDKDFVNFFKSCANAEKAESSAH